MIYILKNTKLLIKFYQKRQRSKTDVANVRQLPLSHSLQNV